MSKNVLITGANGQLGREINRVTQNDSENNYLFTDIAQLDITNEEAIQKIVADNKIDIIINCAAYTNVDKAEDEVDLAYQLNGVAAKNLANVCRDNGATLIHISTDYVFDGTSCTPYLEDSKTSPIGVYGKSKLEGEENILESGCNSIIIRTSWLYSAWGNNFVKTMQKLTLERDNLNVIFDQIGTPTYALDLAEAIVAIIKGEKIDKTGVYHFSNEGVCSWFDFAKEISELSGNSCDIKPIHSWEYPSKVTRPHYSVLDKTKFKKIFDIEIPYWKESLKQFFTKTT